MRIWSKRGIYFKRRLKGVVRIYVLKNACLKVALCAASFLVGASARAEKYPYGTDEVPEDVLEDIAKVSFFMDSGFVPGKEWHDLRVLIVPERTIDGDVSGYYGIVYFGEGEMPTLEELFERSRRGVEFSEKKQILEAGNLDGRYDDEIAELHRKSLIACGGDSETGEFLYWSAFFGIVREGPSFTLGTDGIADEIALSYRARKAIEEKYGVKDLEFKGVVVTGEGRLNEFTADGKRYFGVPSLITGKDKAYAEEDIPSIREPGKYMYHYGEPSLTWKRLFEEIKRFEETNSESRE
jgi:hypothetical protein